METAIKKLLAVVEHLAYSHTFRSEQAGNEVRKLLGEARAALAGPPAAPTKPTEDAGAPTSAEVETSADDPGCGISGASADATGATDGA